MLVFLPDWTDAACMLSIAHGLVQQQQLLGFRPEADHNLGVVSFV